MDRKPKLGALALVTAAAGTGWALQMLLAVTTATASPAAPHAGTPAEAPVPGLSVPAWPQPAAQPGDGGEVIDGLEEMSATGAASPQR